MNSNVDVNMISDPRKVHGGTQNLSPDQWVPFEWDEPGMGPQVHGEIAIIRTHGTSGTLKAGFWRTGPLSPGASRDGSHRLIYSAPLGDETAVVLEGTATLTVKATGLKQRVSPGSIISIPKGVATTWDIDSPYFKKYWCIFNGSKAASNPPKDVLFANISDNPSAWSAYHFTEPKEGPQVAGELFFLREGGSTGTLMSGIWRSGKGMPGTNVDADGTLVTPYTGVLGDETILLLEGEVEVVETDTGRKHAFRAGDVIGLSAGMHITWTSKGPFTKKLWVISRDELLQ